MLVFARTKHGANRLVKQLETDGLSAAALHGNKSQNARTKALDGFKNGTVRVLVATDIAARGIDIDSLPHVVNYELPNVPEDYVHRIGRTGRAGADGEALSLVGPEERKDLKSIEKLIGRQIERFQPEGIDLRAPQGSAEADDDGDRRPARRPGHGKPSRGRGSNDNKPRGDGDKSAPRQGKPHHERARHDDGSDKPRRSNTRRGKRGGVAAASARATARPTDRALPASMRPGHRCSARKARQAVYPARFSLTALGQPVSVLAGMAPPCSKPDRSNEGLLTLPA